MFQTQLPRVYELKDLTLDPASPAAYFRNFETRLLASPLAAAWFNCLEKQLQQLPEDAWRLLKIEAAPYLTKRNPVRGWGQLFNILCQTDAYNYLRDQGWSEVHFIPRARKRGRKTPDLAGSNGYQKVLCEVKRISVSDAENLARRDYTARNYERNLGRGFFGKLQDSITQANNQICAYDPQDEASHIVYVCISFDEASGFNREDELRQVQQQLSDNAIPGLQVVANTWE